MINPAQRQISPDKTKEKTVIEQKTTSEDEDKKYKLIKKLTSHAAEHFRQLNIDDFDLNFTQHFEELQYIDDAVTPLIYCAHFGLKEICKFLLKNKNIDVDLQTENNKQTALIVACMNGNYEIVRHLVLAGAEVNKPNSLNNSPLTAILFRLVEQDYSFENKKICLLIAEFLIKNGADPNWIIEKTKGYSLLHYFCSSKMKMNKTQKLINQEIISFLLNHGANPELKTLKDQTVMDLVKGHCNHQKIVEMLNDWKQRKIQQDKNRPSEKKKFKTIAEDWVKIQIKPSHVSAKGLQSNSEENTKISTSNQKETNNLKKKTEVSKNQQVSRVHNFQQTDGFLVIKNQQRHRVEKS